MSRLKDETTEEFYSRMSREHRNKLLAETDWVVTKAYEEGTPVPPEYVTYRKELRDITELDNFPYHTWPTKP